MARVKAFVNNTSVKLIESSITREGERAIDQAKIKIPICSSIVIGDTVTIQQDAIGLCGVAGIYMMQGSGKDESGKSNHAFGSIARPRIDMSLTYCCTSNCVTNGGFRDIILTENGCVGSTTGKVNTKAIVFDGSNDYVTLSCQAVFNTDSTSQVSFSSWIKTSDVSVPIISKKASATTDTGFEMGIDSCGRVDFRLVKTATSDELHIRGDTAVNTCTWTHIAVTYNGVPGCGGNSTKIYINGSEDTKGVTTSNLTSSILNSDAVTYGAYADGSSKYNGSLDQANIWISKTLTEEEVRSSYLEGTVEETTGRSGLGLRFNGIDAYHEVKYTADHDFASTFDISIWAKWSSTTNGYLLTRRTSAGNGIGITVNKITTGDVVAEIDGNTLKTCGTSYNDDAWHFIRVYRDTSNVVHLDVDNVEKSTFTIGSNLTLLCTSTFIGTNHNKTVFFDGDIDSIRMYNVHVPATQITRLYSCVTSSSVMKFGGNASKVTKLINSKEIVLHSFGKALGETEVRGQSYSCKTPEFIIDDLIRDNTCLIPHIHGTPSGIILSVFNADGKLIDILRDLTQLTGKTFNTDANKLFHLHESAFNPTCFVFTHGLCARNFECVNDDTEIVNDLVVIGENKKYCTIETFSGNACTVVFNLTYGATSSSVTIGGTLKTAEEDYTTCVLQKTITFNTPPASGSNNISVSYGYEVPLLIRGEKQSSIDTHGRHSKRLVMPWIRTKNDGIRFINGYLGRFKDIRTSLKVELGTMKNSLAEGDVVRIVNSIKNIDDSYVVKSVTWLYPDMKTIILAGEFKFDDLEYEKQIIEKLHDLESALTEIKEIQESEQVEEVMVIADTTNIIQAVSDGIVFVESFGMTDTIVLTIVAPAIYSTTSTYGGTGVYGSETTVSGFTTSGFSASGFTV